MTEPAGTLEIVTRSDPGLLRPNNEDTVFGDAGLGLAVLADGMGGYRAGEVASEMATCLVADGLAQAIRQLGRQGPVDEELAGHHVAAQVAAANAAIHRAALDDPQRAGMGTTLVLAWFHDDRVTVAHVGDSRLYRLRGGEFQQVTRDHSLVQEQIDSGLITPQAARHSPIKNLVTKAVGVDAEVETEIHHYEVYAGDLYLLCSDGLNDMVEDDEIAAMLRAHAGAPEKAADALIQAANEHGGRDNVSVILVRVPGDSAAPNGWRSRLESWFKQGGG